MTRRVFCTLAAAATASGARRVFKGRDFDGWHKAGHGIWTIEDSAMVGRSDPSRPGPGYVFTNQDYEDFDLRLEFWISKKGNSGVFIRQPLREFGTKGDDRTGHRPTDGVEVQIDYNDAKNMTGAIYDRQKPSAIRGGGRALGGISDRVSARGGIGFQMHGQQPHDHVVKFRSIEIA